MNQSDVILPLADQLAAVRAEQSLLRKQEAAIIEQVKAAIGNAQRLEGALVDVEHVFQIRESLIADKVRGFLSPQQLKAATRVTEVSAFKIVGKKVSA